MRLSREDCEELKHQGFPQEPAILLGGYEGGYKGGFYIIIGKKSMEGGEAFLTEWKYYEAVERGDYLVKIPQLEELIAFCGDGFALFGPNDSFVPLEEAHKGVGVYYAREAKSLEGWSAVKRDAEIVCKGESPEQAVKKLVIELLPKG